MLRGLCNFVRSWDRDVRREIVGFMFGVARSEWIWRGTVWGLAGSQWWVLRVFGLALLHDGCECWIILQWRLCLLPGCICYGVEVTVFAISNLTVVVSRRLSRRCGGGRRIVAVHLFGILGLYFLGFG